MLIELYFVLKKYRARPKTCCRKTAGIARGKTCEEVMKGQNKERQG